MLIISRNNSRFKGAFLVVLIISLLGLAYPLVLQAQNEDISKKLKGFDQYMEKILKDWNAPGVAVGVVAKDKLIFTKGYGYRDYDKKLPMTPNTLFQIASNTKLFTAVAVGMLIEEGKLEWDKPVRQYVPIIQFYNDELNNTVTIRDMLAHRTGITRHDMIWYKSDFTRKELFERLKYLEPSQPLRQTFLYNNLMYAASGYIIEHLTQKTWEDFLRERIFQPLGMNSTVFSVEEMKKQPDHSVPYQEKRDSAELMQIPHYEDHKIQLALRHYHYDRFDTPDDELWGKWSVNFSTNPQGDVDKALMSLDEAEATFTRKADAALTDLKVLEQYAGPYETSTGFKFQVLLKDDKSLYLAVPGQTAVRMIPYKQHKFRVKEFSDVNYEFVLEDGKVKILKVIDPSGEYQNIRK